jgi:hypothetical protein
MKEETKESTNERRNLRRNDGIYKWTNCSLILSLTNKQQWNQQMNQSQLNRSLTNKQRWNLQMNQSWLNPQFNK